MKETMVVIPSLEPDHKLVDLIKSIVEQDDEYPILIINDGSSAEYDRLFKKTEELGARVLKHDENQGKGAALKTAMKAILKEYPDVQRMVTIDSDGQHSYGDMIKCIDLSRRNPDGLVLGVRSFDKDVPLHNKRGNIITRNIFRLSTGIDIEDTQTGLRIIPREFMEDLLLLPGERFEYETNMLMETKKKNWPIYSQPIETIYIEENESSHFNVFKDSVAIYAVFIKYIFSSLASFAVDVIAFAFFIRFFDDTKLLAIFAASGIARVISATFNYFVNRELVFKENSQHSIFKYGGLVIVQITVSALFVHLVHLLLPSLNTVPIKIVVDAILFLISYQIQKRLIFKRNDHLD